jgi:hypothetical protein
MKIKESAVPTPLVMCQSCEFFGWVAGQTANLARRGLFVGMIVFSSELDLFVRIKA